MHRKQKWNEDFLEKFEFAYEHPRPQDGGKAPQQQLVLLMQSEIDSLKEIFGFPGLFRNPNERSEILKKVEQNSAAYRKRLQEIRSPTLKTVSQVQLEGSVQTICAELLQFRNIEELALTVK